MSDAQPVRTVDVERQCGVPLPDGNPCARALTCKRHGLSSKRAVAGRSQPLDMLLDAYTRDDREEPVSSAPVVSRGGRTEPVGNQQ